MLYWRSSRDAMRPRPIKSSIRKRLASPPNEATKMPGFGTRTTGLFGGRACGGSLGDIVLAAGRLSVASVDQQFSQIAADLADLASGEAMAA